ncbi:MAG: hypothetical protein JNM63_02995, partial [Spirochaetia bacterium]|nr:hypothetical protein [Spirochaetia bacterium]
MSFLNYFNSRSRWAVKALIILGLFHFGTAFAGDSFLKIVDGRMVKDGKPYYRVGYTVYNAFILGITNDGKPWMKKGSPWWNPAYVDESLAEAKRERIPILRVNMTTFWPKQMLLWLT